MTVPGTPGGWRGQARHERDLTASALIPTVGFVVLAAFLVLTMSVFALSSPDGSMSHDAVGPGSLSRPRVSVTPAPTRGSAPRSTNPRDGDQAQKQDHGQAKKQDQGQAQEIVSVHGTGQPSTAVHLVPARPAGTAGSTGIARTSPAQAPVAPKACADGSLSCRTWIPGYRAAGHWVAGHSLPGYWVPGHRSRHWVPAHLSPFQWVPGHPGPVLAAALQQRPGRSVPGHHARGIWVPGHRVAARLIPRHFVKGHWVGDHAGHRRWVAGHWVAAHRVRAHRVPGHRAPATWVGRGRIQPTTIPLGGETGSWVPGHWAPRHRVPGHWVLGGYVQRHYVPGHDVARQYVPGRFVAGHWHYY